MESNGVWALVGAIVIAFLIRVFNIISEWLSRILGVEAPEPIPSIRATKQSVDQAGLGAVPSQQTPEAPSTADPEHPESPSQHP